MRVLVTGHKGYIGSVMAPMLQAKGYEVVGLDNDLFEGSIFGDPLNRGSISDIPNIKKDIREVDRSDLRGCDAVVHLCALSNDPLGYFNPEITYQMNEDSQPQPITPYATSKILGEQGISRLADSTFTPTFMRSATAYGVSPMLRFDLVLNNLVAWAYTTGMILLKSDGMAWRPIVHIEDVSRAFLAVLNAPRNLVHNQVFNVGITAENYQIRELADIVKETVPNSHIEYAKNAGPDKRTYRVDFSKIDQTLPEFKPQWDARRGANQLYETYKKVEFTLEEFEGPRYRRIKHLQQNISNNRLDETLRWRTSETT
jgi:nucleoside-diphosphate-sugar epimerase